jgi:signal transduction histidine kinase
VKVLVVDDLEENRYMLEQLLKGHGYQVVSAPDGVDALEKLGAGGFELIVSDIMMPRMDGFELCHNVRSDVRYRDVPFIFYTATYTSDQDRAFGMSLGADAFILKPTEPELFVQSLHEVIANTRNTPSQTMRLRPDQQAFLREYNERLIAKLDQKMGEVRDANHRLRELNTGLERRIAEKTNQLARSNSELEVFAHTLSHDLRAPLRSIAGFAGILRESAVSRLTPEEVGWLARIDDAVARMDRMIADVLAYSKPEAQVDPVRVELDAVVRDVINAEPRFHDGVRVDGTLLPVMGHEPSVRQVLTNLLSNAVKFQRPGTPPRVSVSTEQRGPEVRIWVADNGIGIPADKQSVVFELFQRLDPGFEGSGVGLAIVMKAVKRMQGMVGVESQPGEGSRFWVQLPAARPGGDGHSVNAAAR